MLVGDETLLGLAERWGKCFLEALAGVFLYLSPGSSTSKEMRCNRGGVEAESCGEGAAPGPWEG